MRRIPLVLGSLLAAGCHAEVPNAVPATASVDVAATPAGPETHFRGHVRVDLAPLDVVEPGGGRKAIAVSAHAEDKEILGCFRSLPPAPTDVWMVARATKSGTIEDAAVVTTVPAPVAECAKKTLGKLAIATDRPAALSFSLHLELAPADCQGDACFAIATPPETEGAEPFTHAFGAGAGTDVGSGFGQGGLGLTGIGEGGGGKGEGIGLGTFGTLGHGDGGVTPVQQSSGFPTSRPTRIKDSGSTVTGRLPPEVIKRIVRQNLGNMRSCYEGGLSATPNLRGKVVVHFTIATDGSVSKAASTESTTMPDAAVVACVTKVFASLAFPEPEGGVVNVTYPISFEPGDDAKASPSDAGKSSKGPKPDDIRTAIQDKREFSMIGLLNTDARLTVNGVGFPQLTASDVTKKLAATGWRTATVEGNVAGAPFVVFAAPPNAPTSSVAKPEGFITSVRRLPQAAAEAPKAAWATATSEGVALEVEGGDVDAANRALIDPPAPTK